MGVSGHLSARSGRSASPIQAARPPRRNSKLKASAARSRGVDVVLSSGFLAFAKHAGFLKAVDKTWGIHRPHGHLSIQNVFNAVLCLFVLILWKKAVDLSQQFCSFGWIPKICTFRSSQHAASFGIAEESVFTCGCGWEQVHPVMGVSVLLLIMVSFLFWVIGLIQRSFWLIDPFWTIIPFMISYFYITHPRRPDPPSDQFYVIMGLLGIWAVRLTHSYFRREGWKFGEREDWRYSLVAEKCGYSWWWISFWAVGVLQQILLTGLSLPVFSVLFHPKSFWSMLDSLAVVICLLGIWIAFSADNALHRYVSAKEKSSAVLRCGLWKFCRHPNYFGEQLFWWGLYLFSLSHGDAWAFIGPLLNTLILVETTRMTENRMLTRWDPVRVAQYHKYQKTTSAWIPWFNSWDKQ